VADANDNLIKQDDAELLLNSPSHKNLLLADVSEMSDPETDAEVQVVVTVGHGPSGFKEKKGGWKFTITETPSVPKPQVDWQAMADAKELFSYTIQYTGGGKEGERIQFFPCRVSKVTPAGVNKDGESMRKIEIVALERFKN
jgi:hypothetical protein